MFKINGFRWMFMLVLVSGAVNADLILDNQRVITNITGIVVSPTSGDIMITTSSKDYTVTQSVGNTTSNAVAITGFSATSSIEEGGTATINWTTNNATSCAASSSLAAWSGAVETSGSADAVITVAGTYDLDLTCQGEAGPVSRTTTVTVTTATAQVTTCASPALSGSTVAWKDFWKTEFPGPSYNNTTTSVARNGYVALEFNTGDILDNGYLATVGNTITSGVRTGSISECPGDFEVAPECTHRWGIGGGISWATDGAAGSCELKPNTTYYFNVTFTDGFDSKSSSCTSYQCIATIQHFNR